MERVAIRGGGGGGGGGDVPPPAQSTKPKMLKYLEVFKMLGS